MLTINYAMYKVTKRSKDEVLLVEPKQVKKKIKIEATETSESNNKGN